MTPQFDPVDGAEADIDAWWEESELPFDSWGDAAYHLVTVVDDLVRLQAMEGLVVRAAGDLVGGVFALRRCLNLARQRFGESPSATGELGVTDRGYRGSMELLQRAGKYEGAVRAFSHLRAGRATCKVAGAHLSFAREAGWGPYTAYEDLLKPTAPRRSLAETVLSWIADSSNVPPIVNLIGESVIRTEPRGIPSPSYRLDVAMANQLRAVLPTSERDELPLGWQFPWGDAAQVLEIVEAIRMRCAYHVVATWFGSKRLDIEGGGVDQLALVGELGPLAASVALLARGVERSLIRAVLDALVYGNGQVPDPALQPLVPLGHNRVAIPSLQLLVLDFQRNLLVLHSRSAPGDFNRKSGMFETKMLANLEVDLHGVEYSKRRTFNVGGEELDLVVADPGSMTLLLCECMWVIRSADPREEIRRAHRCAAKLDQVRRKVGVVQGRIDDVLRRLGLEVAESGDWIVAPVVVTQGTGGAPQPASEDRIPFVPIEVFAATLPDASDLRTWVNNARKMTWTPVEGVHYRIREWTAEMGPWTLHWPIVAAEEGLGSQSADVDAESLLGEELLIARAIAEVDARVAEREDAERVTVLIPYDAVHTVFSDVLSFPVETGPEHGVRVFRVLRDADLIWGLGEFALRAASDDAGQARLARRIRESMVGDCARSEAIRKPELLARPLNSAFLVVLLVDQAFWTDAW